MKIYKAYSRVDGYSSGRHFLPGYILCPNCITVCKAGEHGTSRNSLTKDPIHMAGYNHKLRKAILYNSFLTYRKLL